MNFEKKQQAGQVGGGVMLIGLGLLFLTGWWWPGIMFVVAASILARTMVEGKPMSSAIGAFWLIGIGIIFGIPGLIGNISGQLWQLWPIILIALGLFMLFGGRYRPRVERYDEKPKNDDDDDTYNV